MIYEFSEKSSGFDQKGIYLLGFPFDGTASFRKGTVKGPDAIRRVSDGIETFSPYLHKDLEDFKVFDLGNLPLADCRDVEKTYNSGIEKFIQLTSNLNHSDHKLITLGGEHSISYAPLKKYLDYYEDLVVLHLDAHADLRNGYQGYHYSHASIIRRVLDNFKTKHELIQYGIRSGTKEEFTWMKENGTRCNSLMEFLSRVKDIPDTRPVYLTFDLDYFDPGIFPGTGTPEPGGEDFHSFIKLIKILNSKNFVGADIVELSPDLDSSDCSSVVATKVLRETILAMN